MERGAFLHRDHRHKAGDDVACARRGWILGRIRDPS
jgi:hypothetical protein